MLVATGVALAASVAAQTTPSDSNEEAELVPYYNNYLREYHLGPEDVISVNVLGCEKRPARHGRQAMRMEL